MGNYDAGSAETVVLRGDQVIVSRETLRKLYAYWLEDDSEENMLSIHEADDIEELLR